jgi:antidote-toxin recognition MazE-like antitoxin
MQYTKLDLGKVLAHDVVNIRAARSGDFAPLIISIPKTVANAMKIKKGDRLRIYTDGQKIYLDRFEIPEI